MMGGLRFRLRAATATAHESLEGAMALDARCGERHAYRALLARLWGIYQPLDAALARVEPAPAGVDLAARTKLPWLAQDLDALGVSPVARAALPRAGRLPALPAAPEAMGALYVVEGASLGGQIISRRLSAQLGITAANGGRFFSSYGPDVGERWRAFTDALERFGESPGNAVRVERAALETFACFQAWLADDPAPAAADGGAGHVR